MSRKPHPGSFSIASARAQLSEVVHQAHYNDYVIPILRRGRPYAAVVSSNDGQLLEIIKQEEPSEEEIQVLAESLKLKPVALATLIGLLAQRAATSKS